MFMYLMEVITLDSPVLDFEFRESAKTMTTQHYLRSMCTLELGFLSMPACILSHGRCSVLELAALAKPMHGTR
jgi:hypothetical protein